MTFQCGGENTAWRKAGFHRSMGSIVRLFTVLLTVGMMVTLTACNSTSSKTSPSSTGTVKVGDHDGDLRIVSELPPPSTASSSQSAQRIAENDVLEIDVFQVDELDRTVRVEPNGKVTMPLIGSVKAAGLTIAEFENKLKAAYGADYLQSPEITVFMKESFGQRVTMDGEFKEPGIYPVTSQTTLLQMVARASGMTELADEKKIFIYRQYDDGKKVANYSVSDIRSGKTGDPRIYGGDVVVAFTSDAKVAARNLRDALGIASSATRVITPF